MKYLVVVDMQNDFISGALGSVEAEKIVPYVKEGIEKFEGKVLFTRDTHFENYMDTQEGKKLPVPHCIKGTDGWQIKAELDALRQTEAIDKITFGSTALVEVLKGEENIESIVIGESNTIRFRSSPFATRLCLNFCKALALLQIIGFAE